MDPDHRVLLQVTLDDAAAADEIFSVLMGEDVESRRSFIQRNAATSASWTSELARYAAHLASRWEPAPRHTTPKTLCPATGRYGNHCAGRTTKGKDHA
jgi:hypothetical protein